MHNQQIGYHRFRKGCPPGLELDFPLQEIPSEHSQLASPTTTNGNFVPAIAPPRITLSDYFEVTEAVRHTTMKTWPVEYAEKYGLGDGPAEPLLAANVADSYAIATLVHMDHPTDLYQILVNWLIQVGAERKDGKHYIPFVEHFVGDIADLGEDLYQCLSVAFQHKYYFGQQRPEEFAGWNMTLYPEGCPTHPSYPAGHGTVAGRTARILVEKYNMTDAQKQTIILASRQFAHGRTWAGVHYAVDNDAGWQLGANHADILSTVELPDPLAKYYPEVPVDTDPELG